MTVRRSPTVLIVQGRWKRPVLPNPFPMERVLGRLIKLVLFFLGRPCCLSPVAPSPAAYVCLYLAPTVSGKQVHDVARQAGRPARSAHALACAGR